MRIRKHASKILGSASSCQAWLSTPAPSVDDPAPPHGEVCELNQSPWDVMPSPQLPELHLSDLPHLKVEEEDDDDDDDDDHIILSVVRRNNEKRKKNKNKKNKKDVVKMETDEISSIASLKQCKQSCNKSDGKGWRCKKPAQTPHTLCQYHLAQLRSYNAAYRAPTATGQRKPNTGASANTGTGLYYYYSGFGPWRGKRRSGEKVAEDDDDDDDDNEEGERAEVVESVDNGKEIDNVEEDGSDGDEELEEKKRKSGHCGKKRGRRRIKARSLKSLL
ncbi:hypothetical protein J5N97_023545 [Dioscorea zingiberensis]|uniref:WRC domain-containing protein n=1 Tax=Dioscorea zingiberensis TaxID=325984 RepID=A0A9D5C5G2_9LILI|nr:hypothetical protein J5N97_023545 [Dioscorea zingiberensis]